MYSGSSDGESHDTSTQRKIPPASSMLWVRNLRRYIGSGAGLGSEALMGKILFAGCCVVVVETVCSFYLLA